MVDLTTLSPSERARQLGKPEGQVGVELGLRQGVFPDMQTTLMLGVRYFYRGALQ